MLTSLALIFLLGMLLGAIAARLKLPSLLGMLITGVVLGPYVLDLIDGKLLAISADLRQLALVIILTRAGLALNLDDLKKVGSPAVLMCFVPACFEIAGMLLLAPRLLGISLLDAAILGSVVAAVSPAVVVPRMLKLMDEGFGADKSIPQLIMAGASVDDVFFLDYSSLTRHGWTLLTGRPWPLISAPTASAPRTARKTRKKTTRTTRCPSVSVRFYRLWHRGLQGKKSLSNIIFRSIR